LSTVAQLSAHAAHLAAIRERSNTAAIYAYRTLPHYTEEVVPLWLDTIRPIVQGTQAAVVNVTEAFIAASLQDTPTGIDPKRAVARVAKAEFETLYRSPLLRTWRTLAEGAPLADAVDAGGNVVTDRLTADIQYAQLGATQEAVEARPYVQAYRRVLTSAKPCERCWLAAGNTYTKAEMEPVHDTCKCGVEPIPDRAYVKSRPGTGARDVGSRINSNGDTVDKPSKKEERTRKRLPAEDPLSPTTTGDVTSPI
jgi:hypothetical protein